MKKTIRTSSHKERYRNIKLSYRNNKINFSKPHYFDCAFKNCKQLLLNSKAKFFYDWKTKFMYTVFSKVVDCIIQKKLIIFD